MALAIVLTAIAFAAGLGLSWWQARRRFRRHLADRLARGPLACVLVDEA